MNRKYILIVALGMASATGQLIAATGNQPSPNIIVIVSDDQGYGDLGCYGSQEAVTPNLDRLASGGVRLTDFYVTHPSCTPSRAGLLTGRYPQRYGTNGALVISHHAAFSKDKKWHGGIPANERLLPEFLKEQGYATGCFGKWHLGYGPGQKPKDRGFDHSLVCAAGLVDYYTGEFFGQRDIYRDGKLIKFSGYTTDAFADEAIEFIRDHREHPFFVYLPFNAVHYSAPSGGPDGDAKHGENEKNLVQAPTEDLAEFAKFPKQRKYYLAALKRMDEAIGRLDAALDELGMADNTLVIFFSDNGGDLDYGATNGELRGEKGQLWEGGVRVPAIVRWPEHLPADRVCNQPLVQLDFFSMALAAAGAKAPQDRVIDGRDPTATLAKNAPSPHDAIYFKFHQASAMRAGKYKLLDLGKEPSRLYDLSGDPGEKENLAAKHPQTVRRLNGMLQAWQKKTIMKRGFRK